MTTEPMPLIAMFLQPRRKCYTLNNDIIKLVNAYAKYRKCSKSDAVADLIMIGVGHVYDGITPEECWDAHELMVAYEHMP